MSPASSIKLFTYFKESSLHFFFQTCSSAPLHLLACFTVPKMEHIFKVSPIHRHKQTMPVSSRFCTPYWGTHPTVCKYSTSEEEKQTPRYRIQEQPSNHRQNIHGLGIRMNIARDNGIMTSKLVGVSQRAPFLQPFPNPQNGGNGSGVCLIIPSPPLFLHVHN